LIRLEPVIEELERDKALKADMLNKVSTETYALKIEGVAEKYRGENITEIQHPSPPSRSNSSKKLNEAAGGIAAGGVALGFGLAFLWELLLDRSLRRQKEVVERLKLPVFLNVPFMKNGKERIASLKPGGKVELLAGGGSGDGGASGNGGGEVVAVGNGPPALWGDEHAMRPFHDTLRDRLVANFEMLNLTHKPKLVAVTSCGDGAGVSTIAAGLARSLSETGEGNVLLVDMNSGDGVAHHFSKGKLAMGLDDILENEKENRQGALVQENLYVVQEMNNRDKLPGALPKRFGHLVTQLKASDYDYILLDMPPVTEISITPRLARFMDTILLVVESEVTDRDAAQRAAALLSEGRTNVGVVINKTRTYVPKRLHHEI
jgi:Mrp family chromosome partitioning ATPase